MNTFLPMVYTKIECAIIDLMIDRKNS